MSNIGHLIEDFAKLSFDVYISGNSACLRHALSQTHRSLKDFLKSDSTSSNQIDYSYFSILTD